MAKAGFRRYAWAVVAYNLAVIAWGAYVRISHSGAGCGAHWPLCNGEIVPTSPSLQRLIEFTHRASSGVDTVLILGLLAWAWRAFPARSRARRGAAWATFFIFTEALFGAALVLLGLVNQNSSGLSVAVHAMHMANTLLLLAALAITAAATNRPPRRPDAAAWWTAMALIATAVFGAIAALGDTIFPAASVAAGLHQDFSAATQWLLRVRVLHPALAMATGIVLLYLAQRHRAAHPAELKTANLLTALVILQWSLGMADWALLAPTWLQLTHLVMADLVWITFVLFAATSEA